MAGEGYNLTSTPVYQDNERTIQSDYQDFTEAYNMNFTLIPHLNYSLGDNTTTNITEPYPLARILTVSFIAFIFMGLTVTGNYLVIASYRTNRKLRTINNMFLVSLAVSDFVIGATSMVIQPFYYLVGEWIFGTVFCDIWLCIDYTLSMASVANLLLICFDRYFSITRPFTYRKNRTRKRTSVAIVIAWILSALLWCPAIIAWPIIRGRSQTDQCALGFLENVEITLVTAILAFFLPVTLMIVLYSLIYVETKKCSQYLEYLKNYRKARVQSGVGSPLLSLRRRSNAATAGNQSPRLKSFPFPMSRRRTSSACTPNSQTQTKLVPSNGNRARSASTAGHHLVSVADSNAVEVVPSLTTQSASNGKSHFIQKLKTKLPTRNGRQKSVDKTSVSRSHSEPSSISLNNRNNCDVIATAPTGESTRSGRRRSSVLCTTDDHAQDKNAGQQKINKLPSSDRKAVRTLSAILLAFILTWMPYNVCVVIIAVCGSYDCIPTHVWYPVYYLCYLNSTANPFCFALCNKTFRETFKKLLCCNRQQKNYGLSNKTSKMKSRIVTRLNPNAQASSSS